MKVAHLLTALSLVIPFHVFAQAPNIEEEIPAQLRNTDVKPTDVIHWSVSNGEALADGTVVVRAWLSTEQGFAVYAKRLSFTGPAGYTYVDAKTPPAKTIVQQITNESIVVYEQGAFEVTFRGLDAWPTKTFPISIRYTGCATGICLLPNTESFEVEVVQAESSQHFADSPKAQVAVAAQPVQASVPAKDDTDLQSSLADKMKGRDMPRWMVFLFAFIGGLLTNLTPCVFPMIPITIRLLGRQGTKPIIAASMYSCGILLTYTVLGVFAALGGHLFGSFLANPVFNLVFAVIMALLGLSMLGFGNFSKIQELGNKMGGGKSSLVNTLFMGAGAGLVASPCTGPILAALLAYTATKQDVTYGTSLLFVYSFGFALPYVFLGGAAAKLSQTKVSPNVQVAIKLLFAAIMFALALYYTRVPAYAFYTSLAGKWPSITAVFGLIGLALCVIWLVVPALQVRKIVLTIPPIVLGIGIFGASQWATSSPSSASNTGLSHDAMRWHKVESDALAQAKSENKPILVDGWAEWCEACKKMDATTFVNPDVQAELAAHWVLLKLDLTLDNDANTQLTEKYGLQSLPVLTLLPSSGQLANKKAISGYTPSGVLVKHLQGFRQGQGKE